MEKISVLDFLKPKSSSNLRRDRMLTPHCVTRPCTAPHSSTHKANVLPCVDVAMFSSHRPFFACSSLFETCLLECPPLPVVGLFCRLRKSQEKAALASCTWEAIAEILSRARHCGAAAALHLVKSLCAILNPYASCHAR
jgi:hypothetical protein